MKSEQIYQALNELAEKLEIEVREHNFRTSGIRVESGLCRIKGKTVYIIDKHKSIKRKVNLLATELARHPHEDVFVVPLVRDILKKYGPQEVQEWASEQTMDENQPATGSDYK